MNDWRDCLLGDVITLKRGYDLPERQRVPGVVPVVSSAGISGYHNVAKVKAPGVVTGRYGTLGEVFYLSEGFWPHNTALYVQDFKGNSPRFISYFLTSMGLAFRNAAGAVPGVNRNHLHQIPVRVPSVKTQEKISSILAAYDDLIEVNTRRSQILEQIAHDLYQEWFVYYRFPGYQAHQFIESKLGLIPVGWEVIQLSDAVEINPKTAIDKNIAKPYIAMDRLSVTQLLIDTANLEYRTTSSGSKFTNHDTLFARITPCLENGKTGYVQFLPENSVAIGSTEFVVLRSKLLTSEYVYCLARRPEFRMAAQKTMTGASGRQRVQNSFFEQYQIVKPSSEILHSFADMVSPCFTQIKVLGEKSAMLRECRDMLLPRLISGELDVSTLEIQDEDLEAMEA